MKIKMKENVKVNSFTFKKRVIEETLELLGRKNNYIENDVWFTAMICFVNNLVENNIIIDTLYDDSNIEAKMYETVEPLYEEYILGNEEYMTSFTDIVEQLLFYMDREVENRHSITGILYDLFGEIGELTQEDLANLVTSAIQLATKAKLSNTAPVKEIPKKTDKEIEKEVKKDIENLKMKALIEQYQRASKSENKDTE